MVCLPANKTTTRPKGEAVMQTKRSKLQLNTETEN